MAQYTAVCSCPSDVLLDTVVTVIRDVAVYVVTVANSQLAT